MQIHFYLLYIRKAILEFEPCHCFQEGISFPQIPLALFCWHLGVTVLFCCGGSFVVAVVLNT